MQVDLDGEPPVVPFRLTGGEAEALEFFTGAWLDFYVATNKPEWQRMQQRILADKNTAFFYVFRCELGTLMSSIDGVSTLRTPLINAVLCCIRNAIAAGCLSTRQVWFETRESERKSYRVTDLGSLACRTMDQVCVGAFGVCVVVARPCHSGFGCDSNESLPGGRRQRDFEAHVARRDHQLQSEGPGWGLVGYYNLSAGGKL
jgi:hypothetical protein